MAALRAPGGRMQGAEAQAMSVHIVEPTQRRPRPTYAACGGNGGWARRPPGLAAAAPAARYRGPGSAATRRAHGSCWALPSSVWRRLHGPECGRSLRCSSSTIHTGIAFVVAPCARLTIPTHARDPLYFHHGLLAPELDPAHQDRLALPPLGILRTEPRVCDEKAVSSGRQQVRIAAR